jgi:hypothetical protein
MKKIKQAAIKKPSGKVITAPRPANHKKIIDIDKLNGGTGKGERGFKTEDGKFVGRQEAKVIAKRAKQAVVPGKRGLHSEDLF